MVGMVISAILTFFWALMIDVAQSSTEYAVEGAEPVSTMIPVVCVILGIISFIMFYKKRKKEKMMKEAEKAEKLEKGYLVKATFKHTTGLPFPEGSLFSVYLKENAYAFERNSSTFNLPFEKITDVTITTSTELQKSYASSVGGALGGAVLFGTLGAMVGGRAKEKTSTVEYKYLVFTYQKDNDVDYISFDVTSIQDNTQALKFVVPFTSRVQTRREIQL